MGIIKMDPNYTYISTYVNPAAALRFHSGCWVIAAVMCTIAGLIKFITTDDVYWSYPRNMDTGLSEVLVFKLFRTEAATPTLPPPPIVITFDIIKYRCPHYFPADKVFSMDTFHFQRMKEAFHADYAASVAPDNLLNSTGLHGPCER